VTFKHADFFLGTRLELAYLRANQTCLTSKFETVSGEHVYLSLISQLANTPAVCFASDTRAFLSFSTAAKEGLSAYKIVFSNSELETQLMVLEVP
jgi:hypothetical protein